MALDGREGVRFAVRREAEWMRFNHGDERRSGLVGGLVGGLRGGVLLAALAAAGCGGEGSPQIYLDPKVAFECDQASAGVDTTEESAPPALSELPATPHPAGAAAQPSGDAAAIQRLLDGGHWAEAEPVLRRVARGETGDDVATRQQAEYDLGVVLFRTNRLEESLTLFRSIAARPRHSKVQDTFLRLWDLALKGPPYLDRAARVLATYHPETLNDFASAQKREAWWAMMHVVGRYWYRAGHYAEAAALLERVPPRSDAYSLARHCLALTCQHLPSCAPASRGPF
jgi:hypothetical protein